MTIVVLQRFLARFASEEAVNRHKDEAGHWQQPATVQAAMRSDQAETAHQLNL